MGMSILAFKSWVLELRDVLATTLWRNAQVKQITVRAPISLLLDPELETSAKVIWMVVRLHNPVGQVDLGEPGRCAG